MGNGGIEQWGLNQSIEKDQWGALVRVNAGIEKGQWGWHWSGSMGVLKRVNGGVGQGQCGHGEGSGPTGAWLWVRQGRGCGSDRGVAVGSDRRLSYRVEEVEKKQCRKCGCWRVLKLYRGENATCNICLGYRESWAGKSPEKVRDMNRNYWAEHREEKKVYNKEYSQREIECEVCECKVRKCNWARHVASRKHMLGGGGGKVDGDVGGGGG